MDRKEGVMREGTANGKEAAMGEGTVGGKEGVGVGMLPRLHESGFCLVSEDGWGSLGIFGFDGVIETEGKCW